MNPIRKLRYQIGATQSQLAKIAGTSQPTIALYEAGKKSPTLETMQKIAKSFGLEVATSFVPPVTREDLRSLAYHQAVVEKLRIDPEKIIVRARRNINVMLKHQPGARNLLTQWQQWLRLPLADLIHCCLDMGPLARDMRQVTPFAGVLSAAERAKVIKKFRQEVA